MTLPSESCPLTHADALECALAQARAAEGRTSPNPPVGAAVLRDGVLLGVGATSPPGGPHAEVAALAAAGPDARGADLYTTLEPCTFHGRTPPCTDAIIAAGIRRVFYVARDPDPRIGAGCAPQLRAAGVAVERLPDPGGAVAELLAPFRCRVCAGRPLVTAKYAMTLDGRIASTAGDSRWVSGGEARRQVHLLRDRVDAIMVGVGTLLADDPALTTRLDGHWRAPRHPLRVIVDSHGRAPLDAQALAGGLPGQTLLATVDAPQPWAEAAAARGVLVERLPADAQGRVSLPDLLALLARRGVNHLLVEGGAALLGALAEARLLDQIWAFVAPKLIGGADAPGPLGGLGIPRMADAQPFALRRVEQIGGDVLLVAREAEERWWKEINT
ncbi:MAG TPA: bifunctional diaminohydroxyphosphoribosylaminopyrimidine deaminase/5-amino-6-(5-phosphoribosylamino)uracil reductase RibD [Roseiflexaceae bacterium]|nr:bifunctional diaminohydroxyphosphoribosylaminopyrimidine deaminase/5-amino-6-(5-phosphoribosylamino)uracil reductase RibD [Roseiflexaceae bacterium]